MWVEVWLIRFSVFSVEVVPPKGGQSRRRLMLASNVLYFCLRPFSFFLPYFEISVRDWNCPFQYRM